MQLQLTNATCVPERFCCFFYFIVKFNTFFLLFFAKKGWFLKIYVKCMGHEYETHLLANFQLLLYFVVKVDCLHHIDLFLVHACMRLLFDVFRHIWTKTTYFFFSLFVQANICFALTLSYTTNQLHLITHSCFIRFVFKGKNTTNKKFTSIFTCFVVVVSR